MEVIVDLERCQGHARCEDICPEIFATDPIEGKCVIRQPQVSLALEQQVRLAIRNCPEGALRLSRSKDGAQ